MILDAEKAVIDYLTDNMFSVVGQGNETVEIHRYRFPDDADPEAISVYDELPGNHSDVPEIMPAGIRIVVRSAKPDTAFTLMQNVDDLLDKMVCIDLNTEIECALCQRNSGPDRFEGENNGLHHYTALYAMTMREK